MTVRCIVEGCGRPAKPRSALCSGHLRRRQANQPLNELAPRGRTPWRTIWDAVDALLVAPECEERRARKRLEVAMLRWFSSRQ